MNAPSQTPGRLIVLEGLDGAGTTSQAKRLCQALSDLGIENHLTRQPSDGPIGKVLRQMLTGQHLLPDGSAPTKACSVCYLPPIAWTTFNAKLSPPWRPATSWCPTDGITRRSPTKAPTRMRRGSVFSINVHACLTLFLRVAPEVAAHRRMLAGRVQELFEDLPMQQNLEWPRARTRQCQPQSKPTHRNSRR